MSLDVTSASVAVDERFFIRYPLLVLESGKGFRPEKGCLEGLGRAGEDHRRILIGRSSVLTFTRIPRRFPPTNNPSD